MLIGFLALLPLLSSIVGTAGSIAGRAAGGAAGQRLNENQLQVGQNRNQIDLYQAQQQALLQALLGQSNEGLNLGRLGIDRGRLDLDQRRFALDAPNVRGRQALTGSLLQNMQPVRMSGLPHQIASRMPTITGGLTPAAIGPLARQMGLLMQQNAVQGQRAGDRFTLPDVPERTNFGAGILQPPQLPGLRGAGSLEKILGGVGLGGSIGGPVLGLIGKLLQDRQDRQNQGEVPPPGMGY